MIFFLFFSTVSSPILFSYESDEEYMDELEYVDPYEGEGPISSTPPPACDGDEHKVCVPPSWGEKIPGPPVHCRCVLCHEDGRHHAIRCVQCGNAPGCCTCIWDYMRSRYNSGCPLCRAGDPKGEDPLATQRTSIVYLRRGRRMISRRGASVATCGVGRGTYPDQGESCRGRRIGGMTTWVRGRGRGRGRGGRGRRGRGTTIEEEKKEEGEKKQ